MLYGTPSEWERITAAVRASCCCTHRLPSVRRLCAARCAALRACVRACVCACVVLVRAQRKQHRISEFARARACVRVRRDRTCFAPEAAACSASGRQQSAVLAQSACKGRPGWSARRVRRARTHERSPRASATRGPIADALLNQFGSQAALRAQPRHAGMGGGLHLRRGSFGPRGRAGAALGRSTRSTRSCKPLPVRYLAVDTDG